MPFTPEETASGRWRGGFRHPITGKRIRKTFDYAYEAEAWSMLEEEKAHRAATSQLADEPAKTVETVAAKWTGPTIADYGRDYLRRRTGILARATANKYAAFLDGLNHPVGDNPPIGGRRMGTVKRSEIEQWITDQVAAGVGRPTINGRLGMLRRLYRDLIADGEAPIQRDPTYGIKTLAENQEADRILSPDEESRLLNAAPAPLRLAAIVALDTGLRWSEVFALRPMSFLGGQTGTDYVTVSHVVERGSRELRPFPKSRRRRVVPTTDRLSAELADVLAELPADALLFPNGSGGVMDYANFRHRYWYPTLYAIGLATRTDEPTGRIRKYGPQAGEAVMKARYDPEFGFHALRHTYGSRLAAAGVPRSQIRELMGHADERTTGRYIHAGDDGRRLVLVREALAA